MNDQKFRFPMNSTKPQALALTLLLAFSGLLQATPTFWTGPEIPFFHHAGSSEVDEITTNHVGPDSVNNVWLDRGTRLPLYNAAAESGWNGSTSPVNTMWVVASGPLTSATNLTFDTFDNVVGQPGNTPSASVGQTFFVHIVSDDIYLQLTLTDWGSQNTGDFGYNRTTPAAVVVPPTPTVSLTNPVPSSVFAAPAALQLKASASVSSGSVTNVKFFANTTTALGSVAATPFTLTSTPLAAGNYALTAVATSDAGVSATSSVVNVSVVAPVNTGISTAHVSASQFNFSYNVSTGLTYVVQSSSNLLTWVAVATNTPTASPASFSVSVTNKGGLFFRINRMPNP